MEAPRLTDGRTDAGPMPARHVPGMTSTCLLVVPVCVRDQTCVRLDDLCHHRVLALVLYISPSHYTMSFSTTTAFFSCPRPNLNGPLARRLLQSRAQLLLAKRIARRPLNRQMRNLIRGSFPFPLMILKILWYAALARPFHRLQCFQHLAFIFRTGPGGNAGTSQPSEAS